MSQPVEQSKKSAATNTYFTYAGKQQRKYVKNRVPVSVKHRVKKGVAERATQPVLKVEECTSHYLKTLLDPFDQPAGACLPADMFPLPSQKLKVFARGSCVLGPDGYGFCNAAMTLGSDVQCTAATTVTSPMTSSTLFGAAPVVATLALQFYSQLPWTAADIAANYVQGRGVALGLRVRYAGTESGRNGILNFYEDPDHIAMDTLSYDLIRQRVNTYSVRPAGDGSWNTVIYSGPVSPAETEFRNVNYLSSSQAGTGGVTLICAIKGIAGDTYEYEVFQHIEAIGVQTTGKSASHADPINYGKAQETVKNAAGIKSVEVRDGPGIVSQFIHKVIQMAPFIVEQGSNIVKALEGDPMALLSGLGNSAGMIYKSIQGRGNYNAGTGRRAIMPK